ncbi:MAG: rod shape-determining protein MreD [Coriobacteriia bacterium]|nr:rod shape-determining protein MreD [Coriobacteriia bacterium]MBN2840299.1 rod shape-determining protein MreD [Coriobacteriia bacterium]
MTRWWTTAGALLGALVLQVMIAPHIAIFGVTPNLLLLVVITLAFVEGSSEGATVGFVAGLLMDLLSNGPIGAWALVMSVVGYLSGSLTRNLFAEGWLAPVTVGVIAALVADFAYLIVVTVIGVGPAFWSALGRLVLPRAVYNAVLVILVYPWLARFLRTDRSIKSFRRLA